MKKPNRTSDKYWFNKGRPKFDLPLYEKDVNKYINYLEVEVKQLKLYGVGCSFTDKEVLSNSLRFALKETPKDEQGALNDFKKYQGLMRKCMTWLKDNYKPPCDGFMNECEV